MAKDNLGKPLRANQRRAVEAILQGMTRQQAAAAAGVLPATLSQWLAQPNVRTHLNEQSSLVLKDASIRLKATVDDAITILRDAMGNEEYSPAVRLRAADMTITHALKLLETADLLERIELLEEKLDE